MKETKKKDMVNHPDHYIHGGIETIDVIKAFTEDLTGIEAVDTANIIKYISRWKSKNGLEDLQKAQWYLNHLINLVESNETEKVLNLADNTLREFAMPKPVMPKTDTSKDDREVFFDDGVHQPLPEEKIKSRWVDEVADDLSNATLVCVKHEDKDGLEIGKVYKVRDVDYSILLFTMVVELEGKPGCWYPIERFELVINE